MLLLHFPLTASVSPHSPSAGLRNHHAIQEAAGPSHVAINAISANMDSFARGRTAILKKQPSHMEAAHFGDLGTETISVLSWMCLNEFLWFWASSSSVSWISKCVVIIYSHSVCYYETVGCLVLNSPLAFLWETLTWHRASFLNKHPNIPQSLWRCSYKSLTSWHSKHCVCKCRILWCHWHFVCLFQLCRQAAQRIAGACRVEKPVVQPK